MTEGEKMSKIDELAVRMEQFIIAVNGASIAYTLKLLENQCMSLTLVPAGLAIFFWGISFYCGVSSIRRLVSTRIIEIFRDRISLSGDPKLVDRVNEEHKKIGDFSNALSKWSYYTLYLGCAFFTIWQGTQIFVKQC